MNLFLDTETTGLIERHWQSERDYKMFPKVLSIAWRYKEKSHYYLIYHPKMVVPEEITAINGITTAMVRNPKQAWDFDIIIERLLPDAEQAGNIIGHNIYYDTAMVKSNVYQWYKDGPQSDIGMRIAAALHKDKRICTMWRSRHLFKNSKFPKLKELHMYLFGEEHTDQHDAEGDVRATERCFKELRKRKII